ncbi:MAG: pyruvate formate lyase-activating protein [Oscillospiraceae bacterium]|jgi:pyruvate formate lyase activating enzyme|nr:pyruvate formate lyase-activating protein [Oscillospiraceae bacterium]
MLDATRKALRAQSAHLYHTETFGTVDGPGVRFVAFLQGCPLRCVYCHNPDSVDIEQGERRTAGSLVREILRYRNYYKGGGVTFSGGEPLLSHPFVAACEALLAEEGMESLIDTAGLENPEVAAEAIAGAKLILLDIKAHDDALHLRLTGHHNTAGRRTLAYCEEIGKPVWIRHVLVPGYTLDEEALGGLAAYLRPFTCIQKVELLPFHKFGEPKWASCGRKYALASTPAVGKDQLDWAWEIFAKAGFSR